MGIGRPGLLVQVVGVVPAQEQPRVTDRGPGRRAGAHHDPGLAAEDADEGAVACLGPLVGGQPDAGTVPEDRLEGLEHPVDVPVVREHHHRSAVTGPGGHHEPSHGDRPVLLRRPARQRRPGRCGCLPRGDPPQQGRTCRIVGPGTLAGGCGRIWRGRRCRSPTARFLVGSGDRPLGPGVPGRDREPEDVPQGAAVALGDGPGGGQDAGGQDGLGADHRPQRHQPALVLGLRDPLQEEAVVEAAGEAHPHPHPRPGRLVEVGRHQVVEGAVQVGQAGVDEHPRHGVLLRDGAVGHRAASGRARTGTWRRHRHQRQLLAHRCAQTAARSASTRSTRSQGKASSTPSAVVRPKCP